MVNKRRLNHHQAKGKLILRVKTDRTSLKHNATFQKATLLLSVWQYL